MTASVNVPLEPTEEMLAVMCAAFNSDESISYRKIYQDMLAARPQPPALAQDDAGLVERLSQQNKTLRAAQKACADCDGPTMEKVAELTAKLAFYEKGK